MKASRRRIVLVYIGLVVFSLATLETVFRAGGRLTAPIRVRGAWRVELDDPSAAALACLGLTGAQPILRMNIVQSGPRLLVRFGARPDVAMSGQLTGRAVTIGVRPSANGDDAQCPSPFFFLSGGMPPQSSRVLRGTLTSPCCKSGSALPIRAIAADGDADR